STTRLRPAFPLFPYTTLFRSVTAACSRAATPNPLGAVRGMTAFRRFTHTAPVAYSSVVMRLTPPRSLKACQGGVTWNGRRAAKRSEEHTSELQSRVDLVCRLR